MLITMVVADQMWDVYSFYAVNISFFLALHSTPFASYHWCEIQVRIKCSEIIYSLTTKTSVG